MPRISRLFDPLGLRYSKGHSSTHEDHSPVVVRNSMKKTICPKGVAPWEDQELAIAQLKGLDLGQELENLILRENAVKLLGSV